MKPSHGLGHGYVYAVRKKDIISYHVRYCSLVAAKSYGHIHWPKHRQSASQKPAPGNDNDYVCSDNYNYTVLGEKMATIASANSHERLEMGKLSTAERLVIPMNTIKYRLAQ